MSVRTKLESWLLSLHTGAKVEIANDGKAVEEIVIRYKDFYFMIDIDVETQEPTGNFGWSRQPMTHTPIRDFYIARKSNE